MGEVGRLEAVGRDWRVIRFIRDPSLRVQLVAVKHNGWAIKNIENPSEGVLLGALEGLEGVGEFLGDPGYVVKEGKIFCDGERAKGLLKKFDCLERVVRVLKE